MCFFPFSFSFRVWMNPSMTTQQVSAVCLSVCLSVHRSVSVLSLNSHLFGLFGCSATAVEANLHGLALKTVRDGSWKLCEPHSDIPDRAMAIRHSHFGLQRRVTPNTNVALVSTHLTKHKFVLSVASACSAGVIMQAWCCQSSRQGESEVPSSACFMPVLPERSQELLPRRKGPCFALAPLYPEHNYWFWSGVERGGEGRGRKGPQQEINLKELISMPTCRNASPKQLRGGGSSRGEPEESVTLFLTLAVGINSNQLEWRMEAQKVRRVTCGRVDWNGMSQNSSADMDAWLWQ